MATRYAARRAIMFAVLAEKRRWTLENLCGIYLLSAPPGIILYKLSASVLVPALRIYLPERLWKSTVFQAPQRSHIASALQICPQDEEKEHGVCVVRDGFCIVITSWRPVTSFATDMKDYVPLHELKVFAVEIDG
eukprot:80333-Chlamydomonas_euryale.AAC.6